MSERLSIVIPTKLKEEIDQLQQLLKMDKSSLIRYLMTKSIDDIKIDFALEEYRKGKVSFGKASELAGVNLWRFIDICHEHQVPLNFTEEDAEMGISFVSTFELKDSLNEAGKKRAS